MEGNFFWEDLDEAILGGMVEDASGLIPLLKADLVGAGSAEIKRSGHKELTPRNGEARGLSDCRGGGLLSVKGGCRIDEPV